MNFRIELHKPKTSRIVFALVWSAFLLLFVVTALIQQQWIFAVLGIPGTLLLGGWQLKILDGLYEDITEIVFFEGKWFIIERDLKVAIEVKKDSVNWPLWVSLKFRELDPSKPNRVRQLILFRDAMKESEFRQLSRTLKFYKAE
ncbi:protein YgfX [Kangiella shandongensis]|uniref:protein YgfX n=1 Tax=Kangiella shandongensis TaxID=2763258 RepID=UPI001CBD2A8B|nr:protein YgfX [Kangiella shandongensis]